MSRGDWGRRAVQSLARALRGEASEPAGGSDESGPAEHQPAANTQPVWGHPAGTEELLFDVPLVRWTAAGLEAIGLGEMLRTLADPFRLVIDSKGVYFYSYADRKNLDGWLDWSRVLMLMPQEVPMTAPSLLRSEHSIWGIEFTVITSDGSEASLPMVPREPGANLGAVIDVSSEPEQRDVISRIEELWRGRPSASDSLAT